MDKFWMIVDVSQTEPNYNGKRLPISKRPGFIHCEEEAAEGELLRLQQKYPYGEFVLLEAVAEAKPKTIYAVQRIDGIPF